MSAPATNSAAAARIAIIGGTGKLGAALARRWVKAGLAVIIGSREAARAQATAATLAASSGATVGAGTNVEAAVRGEILIVTVPYAAHEGTLREIAAAAAGKLLIDTTVPLVPPKVMRVQLPKEGAAAVKAQLLLGPAVTVVAAFHSVAAHKLATDAADRLRRARVRGAEGGAAARRGPGARRGPARPARRRARQCRGGGGAHLRADLHQQDLPVDGAGIRITGALVEPPDE